MKSAETASVITLPARPAAKQRRDTEFLPAALEIIETPASPAGRAIALTIIAFVSLAILWSFLGKVDIIVTSPGRIIPMGKSKVIQPFETGVVREIKVADGESVQAGAVLVELDPTSDASDEERLVFAYSQDRLDILRLRALLDGKASFPAPADIDPRMVAVASRQMEAQLDEHQAKLENVARQRDQKRAEGHEIEAAIEKIVASLPLISEQRDIRNTLLANQYGSRLAYLQVQQQVVESQHELEAQRHRREENVEAISALERQRAEIDAEFRKTLLTDLAKAEVQASEHREDMAKSAMHRSLRTLRAPVAGTVQQLAVHTLGGIVTPAEQLMVVVPKGAGLEIEATLANKDVGFVHVGQQVEIKVETFNFTRYGLLHGTVRSISQDAVPPREEGADDAARQGSERGDDIERPRAQPAYVAHIGVAEAGLQTEQGFAPLEPGMAVIAEIKTGRRSLADFLLSPLQKLKSESFGER